MNIIGIIPARYQSSRLPGKPLAHILGKSMIRRVYERVKLSKVHQIIVATDDQRIINEVHSFGGYAMMTSKHHISGTDRCLEVAEKLKQKVDLIINIQGDEPFIEPQSINTLISSFSKKDTQIATLAIPIDQAQDLKNPNKPKVRFDQTGIATSFDRVVNEEFQLNTFFKHIGLYAFKPEVLKAVGQLKPTKKELEHKLEQWRWLENNFPIKVELTPYPSYSVDTKEDIKKIEQRFGHSL